MRVLSFMRVTALAGAVFSARTSDAQMTPGAPKPATVYAIRNATVVPVSGPRIVGGTVVIQNGRIAAVGTNVTVPAGATVKFAPSGNHAMLFGVDPRITPGTAIPMLFTFKSGTKIEVEAKTVAAGDDMGGMHP